jgi:hypothetical protein
MRFLMLLAVAIGAACGGKTTTTHEPIGNTAPPTAKPNPVDAPKPACATRVACAIEAFEGFTTTMCTCKDKACADDVQQRFTKWGEEMAKDAKSDDGKISSEDTKRMSHVAARYAECYTKLLTPPNPCAP